MLRSPFLKFILLATLFSGVARAERLKAGDWIGSAGMGFMSSPALFLLSPHLERVYRHNIFFGVLLQAGFGNVGSMFTITGTARIQVGNHPRLRPTLEAGLGVAAATGLSSAIGVHIGLGMGVDYLLDRDIALSTVVRANFAPPAQTFFLSWPIIQVRYLF